ATTATTAASAATMPAMSPSVPLEAIAAASLAPIPPLEILATARPIGDRAGVIAPGAVGLRFVRAAAAIIVPIAVASV
ncbi:hypothetical protein WFJ45_22225, partial [Salmonella enterica subsp. enterica serovar Minnesota]|uniref:hypothetical protein n=1 Tax=Salmonella enterica TaxID=28901 RepID=UPI003D2DEE6D